MNALRTTIALFAAAALGACFLAGSAPAADGEPVSPAAAPIVVGIDSGGGPYLTAYSGDGSWRAGFLPYFDFTQGGVEVAAGDVDGDGKADLVTVPGRGGRGEVRTFAADGTRKEPTELATSSGCGTRIATGDVTGDGKADIVTGFDQCAPNIQVYDGASGKRIAFFGAFNAAGANHGIRVAAGDVNGDGRAEVITGAGSGDSPTVRIFSGTPTDFFPTPLRSFDAFGSSVTSGVEVAAADVNGDHKADVVAAAETPDDAQVKIFDGSTGELLHSFQPFGVVSAGSLRIAASDVDGNGKPEIVAAATVGYSSLIRIFEPDGTRVTELPAPLYGGRSITVGDLDGDGKAEIEMATGPGYSAWVSALTASGDPVSSFQAYDYSFINGVRVAAGDVDGNGSLEYVTGQGAGGKSELLVLDEQGNELHELYPFGESWQGLYVACGDVDGDAKADIVAGAGAWSDPRIVVYDGAGKQLSNFLAFDTSFQGGVRVATGDVDGDGRAEIIAGTGPGGPPIVRIFDPSGARKSSFFAFDPSYTGGIYVASGDLDGDGKAEIVVGSGTTGDVRVFDANGNLRTTFTAYPPDDNYYEGVRVAAGDVEGDGRAEIVTGPGRVRPVDVRIFDGAGNPVGGFRVHAEFQGGIYVALPAPLGPHLTDAVVGQVKGVEGHAVPLFATFRDPRGGAAPETFGAIIHWGDNESSRGDVSALGGGRYRVAATHKYGEFGRYTVTLQLGDTHLRAVTTTGTAVVRDARITARGRVVRTRGLTFQGVVASVKDADPFGSPLDLRARIDWGDGRHSAGRIDVPRYRFAIFGRHGYRKAGVYRVVVRVTSKGGSTARTTSRIVVGRR
jgi:hypothetical protein